MGMPKNESDNLPELENEELEEEVSEEEAKQREPEEEKITEEKEEKGSEEREEPLNKATQSEEKEESSEGEEEESEKKPFAPTGGNMRNFLNSLRNLLCAEMHYLEFASMAEDGKEEDEYMKIADDVRFIRQNMVNAVDFESLREWCCEKHLLESEKELTETIQKSARAGQDVSEMLEQIGNINDLITKQTQRMYGKKYEA